MRYENHADEWREEDKRRSVKEEIKTEGYCPTCEDHTTLFDRFGCCRECGTELQ